MTGYVPTQPQAGSSIVSLPSSNWRDFLYEVGKGNIPGHSFVLSVGENGAIGNTFINLSDIGGTGFFATTGEAWEIVSTSADDALGGIGANVVVAINLDDGLLEVTDAVFMNGTTPVALPSTYLRSRLLVVGLSGSNLVNVGDITLRVSGGGAERAKILANNGVNRGGAITVQAGHTGFVVETPVLTGRNDSVDAQVLSFSPDTNTININGVLPVTKGTGELSSYPLGLPEKTDYWIRAKNDGVGTASALGVISILEVDNNFL